VPTRTGAEPDAAAARGARARDASAPNIRECLLDIAAGDPEFARAALKAKFLGDATRALVRARKAHKLTQADVAHRLGTTQSVVARMEGDRRGSVSLGRYVDWAFACDVLPSVPVLQDAADVQALVRPAYARDTVAAAPTAPLVMAQPMEVLWSSSDVDFSADQGWSWGGIRLKADTSASFAAFARDNLPAAQGSHGTFLSGLTGASLDLSHWGEWPCGQVLIAHEGRIDPGVGLFTKTVVECSSQYEAAMKAMLGPGLGSQGGTVAGRAAQPAQTVQPSQPGSSRDAA
jgi:transcriptional regulator with XRE-family HTH domain